MPNWIEKKCAERGLRMTDQRRIIAQVLSDADDHPDAEELYARASDKDPNISGDDVREGLVAVVSVKLPNPRFNSQTKGKLVNNEIEGVVSKATYDGLMHHLDTNPSVAKKIILH